MVISAIKHQCFSASENKEERLWHLRFGHLNFKDLSQLSQKSMVSGLPKEENPKTVCKECVQCKQTKSSFQKCLPQKSVEKLRVVYLDVCGPIQVKTLGDSRYFVLFIDEWTMKCWFYLIMRKGEVL